jgi:hypothetical protein
MVLTIICKKQEQTQCAQVLPTIELMQIIKYKKMKIIQAIILNKSMRIKFKQLMTF